MTTVDEMVDTILAHEGGYVNDPSDRGGATNFGVTQRTYSAWLGRPASIDDVKAMRVETAREIYLANYYYKPRINGLPEKAQALVFDCAINHGPRRAIKFVQTVINLAGFGVIIVDGICGPDTMGRAQQASEAMGDYFVNAIADERIDFYQAIVRNDPTQNRFIRGWLNRANSFRLDIDEEEIA
jgi:lysozyme family protein